MLAPFSVTRHDLQDFFIEEKTMEEPLATPLGDRQPRGDPEDHHAPHVPPDDNNDTAAADHIDTAADNNDDNNGNKEDAALPDDDDEASRRREREEAMERLLWQQEQEEERAWNDHQQQEQDQAAPLAPPPQLQPAGEAGRMPGAWPPELPPPLAPPEGILMPGPSHRSSSSPWLNYRSLSYAAAVALLYYAFRSRHQFYLAMVFISSSKWAYLIIGNALIVLALGIFDQTTRCFLEGGGLRLQEAESLQDFFRWNVTETCFSLAMFRDDLDVQVAVQFLILILVKCLHHAAVVRQNHVRMTEEAVYLWRDQVPVFKTSHLRLLAFFLTLQALDVYALHWTVESIILHHGRRVTMFFAFEAGIMLVSAWSHIFLWTLHVLDGFLHISHEQGYPLVGPLLHPWKEYKATYTFAVELQAQAVQFLLYMTFFAMMLTHNMVPLNLFREVFVSLTALKERLTAFFKYRRLMAGMNRYENATAEELQQQGCVCIICRDDMTSLDAKRLPVCHHLFHRSCLREWLTNQQICPTCRSDISANERQERARQGALQALTPNQAEAPVEAPAEEGVGESDPQVDPVIPMSEAGPRREKKVRFHPASEADPPAASTGPFPALYRVVHPEGAPVSELNGPLLRTVPCGMVVLAQTSYQPAAALTFLQEEEDRPTGLLRIPDGWIPESSVVRVYTLKNKVH